VGAMKSGTTTLATLLARHPNIYMSRPKEPMFFSRDDIWSHTHFFAQRPTEWQSFDWERDHVRLTEEYLQLFENAQEGQLCGEASTQYLAARRTAERIVRLNPEAKIIIMIRNPVDRAYSEYWHAVRTHRAIYSFEKQMQWEPASVLYRGMYKDQIANYFDVFPRKQVYVCVFEKFIKAMQEEVNNLCHYIGAQESIDISKNYDTRKNEAKTPSSVRLHLLLNSITRMIGSDIIYDTIGRSSKNGVLQRIINMIARKNLRGSQYPPMRDDTRRHLEILYRRENDGLSDLIGTDLAEHWAYLNDGSRSP